MRTAPVEGDSAAAAAGLEMSFWVVSIPPSLLILAQLDLAGLFEQLIWPEILACRLLESHALAAFQWSDIFETWQTKISINSNGHIKLTQFCSKKNFCKQISMASDI
jgi:hypothetical protein